MPSKTFQAGLSLDQFPKSGIFLFWVMLVLLGTVRIAAAAADLGWDLSYQSVIRNHALDRHELLFLWANSFPSHPIEQRMQAYQGGPILGSVLWEQPDGHAGAPMATWIIQTGEGGLICFIHERYPDRPCKAVKPEKVSALIREVLQFKQLATQPQKQHSMGRNADGEPIFYNYSGFLSVYRNGEVMQRPIVLRETDDYIPEPGSPVDSDNGRFSRAVARMLLTEEQFQQRKSNLIRADMQRQLRLAVRQGDVELASALLDRGVTGEESSDTNNLPSLLAIAAVQGRIPMVDFLLSRGYRIDAREGMALQAAVTAGNQTMIEHLLEKGASINPPNDGRDPSERLGNSPLGVAVEKGDLGMVRWLVDKGANVNIDQRRPVIIMAAINMDLAMMNYLLAQGAFPDSMEDNGGNSVIMALMERSGYLGERPDNPDREKEILRQEERIAVLVRRLVAAGADVNLTNRICYSAYLIASHQHSEGMKKLLLELGADPKVHEQCQAATGWRN
ncbi:MAG TPA: ankyrin repeat domain-containing protein [Fluviicoccus sp.]|nr:ankyrin repeat domain-containing protein [Fluviicoccus sp.]